MEKAKTEKIEVCKLDLAEGEEVMELGDKVMAALAQQKGKLKKSLFLRGIYNDHIIAKDRESGQLFRFEIKRSEKGAITLANMTEVRPAGHVPMKKADDKTDETEAAGDIYMKPSTMRRGFGGSWTPPRGSSTRCWGPVPAASPALRWTP